MMMTIRMRSRYKSPTDAMYIRHSIRVLKPLNIQTFFKPPSIPRADDQSWTNPTGPSNASPQAPSPTIPPPGAPITTAF